MALAGSSGHRSTIFVKSKEEALGEVKAWLLRAFQEKKGSSVAKREVFRAYTAFCAERNYEATTTAPFGKFLKKVFPSVETRRLVRNSTQSMYYFHLAKCASADSSVAQPNAAQETLHHPPPTSAHLAFLRHTQLPTYENVAFLHQLQQWHRMVASSPQERRFDLASTAPLSGAPPAGGVLSLPQSLVPMPGHRPLMSVVPTPMAAFDPSTFSGLAALLSPQTFALQLPYLSGPSFQPTPPSLPVAPPKASALPPSCRHEQRTAKRQAEGGDLHKEIGDQSHQRPAPLKKKSRLDYILN